MVRIFELVWSKLPVTYSCRRETASALERPRTNRQTPLAVGGWHLHRAAKTSDTVAWQMHRKTKDPFTR